MKQRVSRHISLTLVGVFLVFAIFIFSPPPAYSAPEMSDYCYLPPFVMDPAAIPNVIFVYEKGDEILKRAYSLTYTKDLNNPYYGFFAPDGNYTYNSVAGNDQFERTNPPCNVLADNKCFPGDLLNWALTSALDASRRALVGFGEPFPGVAACAGKVFDYTGALMSYGQWEDGNSLTFIVQNADTDNIEYKFQLSKSTGSNPTGLSIWKDGFWSVKNGEVAIDYNSEPPADSVPPAPSFKRWGVIQEYIDKDQDRKYDIDAAARISVRRWNNGAAKQNDIMRDTPALTDADRQTLFENMLCAISQSPPNDPQTAYLGSMMNDIIRYVEGGGPLLYADNDAETQTPYDWTTDPGAACRRTFAVFMTTGNELGQAFDTRAPLPPECNALTNTDAFVSNVCYAFNEDLHPGPIPVYDEDDRKQNIRTYVLQTSFVPKVCENDNSIACSIDADCAGVGGRCTGAVNQAALEEAASVGGGAYYNLEDPRGFEDAIRNIMENILATATSASTVATLTTQSRETATLTQAFFFPRLNEGSSLKWIGFLRLLWSDTEANLRVDELSHGILDLAKDDILSFFYDSDENEYKAKLYEDSDADFRIDDCSLGLTKLNEEISDIAIWEAQKLLEIRTPDETAPVFAAQPEDRKRFVAIGIDSNNDGIVRDAEVVEFTTAIDTTLRPYWNFGSYCSSDISRWCSADADCNSCTVNPGRGCAVNADCNYCSGNGAIFCTADADCLFDFGTCQVLGLQVCENDASVACVADADCVAAGVGGLCKYTCTGDPNRFCLADADCQDNFGTCTTTDTCNFVAAGDCQLECDDDCAESIIKFARGFDQPNPSGGSFRIRHECTVDADCPGGTCDSGTCSNAARDILRTKKLGDIVYSTPRLSPNKGVNGYDTRYGDTTYTNFITNTIKQVGFTPITILGANDGMVHAFKVSKIVDLDPPQGGAGEKQVAAFTDDPNNIAPLVVPNDLGHEVWTYIPFNAMPYLKWYCQDDYCHIPMVDARFTVIDASIGRNDGSGVDLLGADINNPRDPNGDSWRRLLIGTMGVGGKSITTNARTLSSSIFVMDITDSENPILIWEQALPDNTLASSYPATVRLGAKDINGTWYVVIGSGAQGISTNVLDYKSTNARLFVFNLRTGAEVSIGGIDMGVSNVAVGDMLAVDMDADYEVDDIYLGTYNSDVANAGDFWRLRIRNGAAYNTVPSTWPVEKVVSVGRPVFAASTIAVDGRKNIWLFFGTGLYLTLEHTTETREFIYGVKETEDCWKGTGVCLPYDGDPDTTTDFVVTRNTVTGANMAFQNAQAIEVACYCEGSKISEATCAPPGNCGLACGPDEQLVITQVTGAELAGPGVPGVCNLRIEDAALDCLENEIETTHGWIREVSTLKFDPNTGTFIEVPSKIFSKPFVGSGLVNLTAFHPVSTPCSLGGETYLVTLHYTTGTPFFQPTILLAAGTNGDVTAADIHSSAFIGQGVPPLGESIVALPLPGDTYKVITQVSGALPGTQLSPSEPFRKGYLLWLPK